MEGILREQNIDQVEQLFRQSFNKEGEVLYYPVRHHSPGCALHLKHAIEQYKPDEILIEGPSDSGQLLPYIADDQSAPPFCIYYSYDDKEGKLTEDKEKYRAYYPFLAFSPELVAIRKGFQMAVPVRFIDLPYAARLFNKQEDEQETQYYYNENKEYEVNLYTAGVASRAGCRSFSEFWESRYELNAGTLSTESFVRNVFYLGYYMRLATPEDEPSLKEDIAREIYMATEIKKSLSSGKRVLVVAGAFHIVGLMEALREGKESVLSASYKPENVASYLMPYTFKEADSKSGYAAGMPFPAFYHTIWDKMQKDKTAVYQDAVLDYIIKTARYARKTQSTSLPDEINAYNMACSLATLRGKPEPGVYELLDGVRSCFVKGDINATSTFEVDFLLRLLSGMGAGKVVDNDLIPPVVKEFRALCSLHRLKTSTVERQEVTLDIIKNPAHFRKSRFLHQLEYLKTGFCSMQSGPDYVNGKNKNLVREIWICRYSTQVETQLIDLSVYGTTLSQMCASLIEREFKDNLTAEQLGKLLLSVQVMGIENFYTQYEDAIRQVIANERNFISLCRLTGSLLYLITMQQLMDEEVNPLIPQLSNLAFMEAVQQITVVKDATEDEEQVVSERLRDLYGYTLESTNGFDKEPFLQAVEKITQDSFSNSRVFGVCLAVCYKEGLIEQEDFCRQITAYLESSINQPEEAASFVCGLFLVARDILFSDVRILEAIDRVIAEADDEQFLTILPNLRYAFTSFLPGELDRLGKIVAQYHTLTEDQLLGSIAFSQEEILAAMSLDKQALEELNRWKL
ncbi:DUF5682 family protein [Bacteroides sp. 224]|uniref:DUF5682 family protein n=1 Tax=Bacteroides sp. 224 TaxID=2302936 RepID=UPI0013D705B5|nr:DUF5682 family protein [Bacteroides sp. 224]NDV67177.1 hypothetical protein [Bacteroides sp. 224]